MFILITWITTVDDRTCPICKAINGFTWKFVAGVDQMGDTLVHPEYGVVWTFSQGSKAHGHARANCRCDINSEVNVDTLYWELEQIKNDLELKVLEQFK